MKHLLGIFIDGLRPTSLQHMPFLATLGNSRPLTSEYGYSITCHASMYSGLHLNRHKTWFVWKKSPETSPFRRVRHLARLPLANTLPGRYFVHKTASLFERTPNTSFFGLPRVVHVPNSTLEFLDVVEKKMPHEGQYLEDVDTLFDFLPRYNLSHYVVGMDKSEKEESKILERFTEHRGADFIYWFIGDVDHFSHAYGQSSETAIRMLGELDDLLAKKYAQLTEKVGDVDVLVWSDHGHVDVEEKIDIYERARNVGVDLYGIDHVVDATCVRFWFNKPEDETNVRHVLEALADHGEEINANISQKFAMDIGDDRYGDLVWFLKPGCIFNRTIWGFSRSLKSMHGYAPDLPESDGVILSNRPLTSDKPNICDITPSILARFGKGHEVDFDGVNVIDW